MLGRKPGFFVSVYVSKAKANEGYGFWVLIGYRLYALCKLVLKLACFTCLFSAFFTLVRTI